MVRATALAVVAALLPSGCDDVAPMLFDSPMVKACEEVIKKRLLAPAGYERVEITEATDVLTAEEYLRERGETGRVADFMRERIEAGETKPTRLTLYIEYDAPNAYGTPIRGLAECTHVASDGDHSRASENNVKVDGKSHSDWLIDGVREMERERDRRR